MDRCSIGRLVRLPSLRLTKARRTPRLRIVNSNNLGGYAGFLCLSDRHLGGFDPGCAILAGMGERLGTPSAESRLDSVLAQDSMWSKRTHI
jgi:hypothetical protein